MHVGLVIYGSLETVTGGYLYDRKLVEYLRRKGDRVTVFSMSPGTYAVCLLHNLDRELRRTLAAAPLDVLLQDELNHPSLFLVNRWLRRHVAYPIVSIVHHLRSQEPRAPWLNRLYAWIERRYLETLDGCVVNSRTTEDTVRTLVNRPFSSVIARPSGKHVAGLPTAHAIAERAEKEGPLHLIYVGNVVPRKGLDVLVEGLAPLPSSLWTLDVVGDLEAAPAYVACIRDRVSALELADRVTLHGRVTEDVLAGLLRQSHLMAVPSAYEGYGIVYVEGMGFGVPALGTTAGAAHEIIEHGENGFLVPPGAATPISRHILTLALDRERLSRMSFAARARFDELPTWDDTGARVRRFLQSLVH